MPQSPSSIFCRRRRYNFKNWLKSKLHVRRKFPVRVAFIGALLLVGCGYYKYYFGASLRYKVCDESLWDTLGSGFEYFDNVKGAPMGRFIVPNYLHFLRYGEKLRSVNFMDAVNILAGFRNQKPDKIFFHSNFANFTGKYWEALLRVPGFKESVVFEYVEPLESIYGQKLHSWYKAWHGSDILRIRILQKHGGIFLDNDVYIVKNLDPYRKFEMSIGIIDDVTFGTMILVAHEDARFLKLWHESYRIYYGHLWYYNAGEKPMREILNARPELVHHVHGAFGVQELRPELYTQRWPGWKNLFSIHTLIRHLHDHDDLIHNKMNLTYPVDFDENNIVKYDVTILEMVRDCCGDFLRQVQGASDSRE